MSKTELAAQYRFWKSKNSDSSFQCLTSSEKPVWRLDTNDGHVKHPPPALAKFQVEDPAEKLDINGQPVDMSKTGTWKAATFLYAIGTGDFQASIGVAINLVPFLATTYHQPISIAATITNDLLGSSFLLSVLGGFVADSYLGGFHTIVLGGIIMTLGLGLLTFTTTVSSLQPPKCASLNCPPAGIQYMAPLYIALYTIALGTGLVRPSLVSVGGEQFDESLPAEKKQLVHFFVWFYFFANLGLTISFTLGVYLQDYVSHGWGYGFSLMFYFTCYVIFLIGTPRIRHKRPTGSFLTRMAQVFVAAMRKWKVLEDDTTDFYTPVPASKLRLTRNLRFMDRAAIIGEEDKQVLREYHSPDPWRLCSVAQVEESKRLLLLVPIWASTTIVTLIFSQLTTFTIQQGMTMDRKIGPDFEIPSASLGMVTIISALLLVPIYDKLIAPIVKTYTKNPYGLTPLSRMGIALVFAVLTMIAAALVERKRLTYVRELHYEPYALGTFTLPMKFWWLLPQYMLSALVEFFFYVAAYEFYFHETAETTRNVGSSFTYSSAAIGYFMSSVIVTVVNQGTRHDEGGGWLEGKLNDGGLENFYWLLALLIFVGELAFLTCAQFYEYRHDWYQVGSLTEVQKAAT